MIEQSTTREMHILYLLVAEKIEDMQMDDEPESLDEHYDYSLDELLAIRHKLASK